LPKMTLLTVLPSLRTNNLKGLAATLTRLIDLGLVEMRDDQPFVTVKGQDLAWVAD
jgi:hypothetical protein